MMFSQNKYQEVLKRNRIIQSIKFIRPHITSLHITSPIMSFNDSQLLSLTSNAIIKLMKPTFDYVTNIRPTCQVLNIKKLNMDTGPDRYKIILSDGTHLVDAVLAYKANWIATKLDSNDIVEIVRYNSVTTNSDNVIIIQDLVIKESHLTIIGDPSLFVPTKENRADEDNDFIPDETSPTPTATYIDQQHTIIDDWIVLTSGSVHGIVREDPTTSDITSDCTLGDCTITTSTVASFCCPNSLSIDFESDFDSINDQICVITITGSCYQLGFKNDSCKWEIFFHLHLKNLTEVSNSPDNFRTGIVNVGDYVSHVFTGTFVGEETHLGKDEMMVELDIDVECGSGYVQGDCIVGLDSLAYTQSRNLYRSLYPETVSNRLGPHVIGERVALVLFGQLTEKGITEERDEYCLISFDDYFSYPIEAQFPTEEVSHMVDLFSKLQHITGNASNGRQYFVSGSIGHMAACFPPIAIGHMVQPAPLKRPLLLNTSTIDNRSNQECLRKKKKV
jgi:hypothetical protein